MNADLLAKAFDILAVCGLTRTKGRGLCQCVSVRNEGVVDPLTHTTIGDGVGRRIVTHHALTAKVVVRMNGHDHRDGGAFRNIGQPQGDVHQIRSGETGIIFACRQGDFDKMFLVGKRLKRAVFRQLSPHGVHGEFHGVAVLEGCVPPVSGKRRAGIF